MMEPVLSSSELAESEYLELERQSSQKHEYLDGRRWLMPVNSAEHDVIFANLLISVGTRLRKTSSQFHTRNLRLHCPDTGLYTYADAAVLCGHPDYAPADAKLETVTNPAVIFEIFSPETEMYDQAIKFDHYRTLPRLQLYVLISEVRPYIVVHSRTDDDGWNMHVCDTLETRLELEALDLEIPLSEIYDGVTFE